MPNGTPREDFVQAPGEVIISKLAPHATIL